MHRVRFGALCVTLLVSAVLASGCVGAAPSPDASLVKATVERYDALLAQGYRSMDMSPISEVATQLQAETEYIHMSSLGEGGVRMLPNLRRLEFVKVSVEGSSALVETLETWDYTHVDPATGAIVREQRGLVYRLAWDLADIARPDLDDAGGVSLPHGSSLRNRPALALASPRDRAHRDSRCVRLSGHRGSPRRPRESRRARLEIKKPRRTKRRRVAGAPPGVLVSALPRDRRPADRCDRRLCVGKDRERASRSEANASGD
jgi:hypothetical protein